MNPELNEELKNVKELMEEVIDDRGVPRNIRNAVKEALDKLEGEVTGLNFSNAIYILDDISNDINMPSHTRTSLWEIISDLESLKERTQE